MRSLYTVFVLALALPGQSPTICHADFNTFNFDNNMSMGGPMVAIRTTAPTGYVATRVEVFTGEGVGQTTVALWSHDAANNQPLASLGSGSWSASYVNGWQGATLGTPVTVTQGQILWVVWSPFANAQSSSEGRLGAGTQPYRASTNGGQTWTGPFQDIRWKFRIWCGTPVGHYESFGALTCRGSNRSYPSLGWFGLPAVGATLRVHLRHALSSSVGVLVIGDSDTTWLGSPLPLSLAFLGAPACDVRCAVTATVVTGIDVTGEMNLPLAFPPNQSLRGWRFYNQWWVYDPTANAFGFTLTNAGRGIVGG